MDDLPLDFYQKLAILMQVECCKYTNNSIAQAR